MLSSVKIGNLVYVARHEKKLTLLQASKGIGVSLPTLHNLEHHKMPTIKNLEKILRFYRYELTITKIVNDDNNTSVREEHKVMYGKKFLETITLPRSEDFFTPDFPCAVPLKEED